MSDTKTNANLPGSNTLPDTEDEWIRNYCIAAAEYAIELAKERDNR